MDHILATRIDEMLPKPITITNLRTLLGRKYNLNIDHFDPDETYYVVLRQRLLFWSYDFLTAEQMEEISSMGFRMFVIKAYKVESNHI